MFCQSPLENFDEFSTFLTIIRKVKDMTFHLYIDFNDSSYKSNYNPRYLV